MSGLSYQIRASNKSMGKMICVFVRQPNYYMAHKKKHPGYNWQESGLVRFWYVTQHISLPCQLHEST
jgi:hypothetical protein